MAATLPTRWLYGLTAGTEAHCTPHPSNLNQILVGKTSESSEPMVAEPRERERGFRQEAAKVAGYHGFSQAS